MRTKSIDCFVRTVAVECQSDFGQWKCILVISLDLALYGGLCRMHSSSDLEIDKEQVLGGTS
jgi:hypothetical protein